MLAAGWPSMSQICRVKAATEVLPLVPVMAAIVPAGAERSSPPPAQARAAHWAFDERRIARRAGWTDCSRRGGCAALRRLPDESRAVGLVPATATNRSPFFTLRLSAVTPATSSAARRGRARLRHEVGELHLPNGPVGGATPGRPETDAVRSPQESGGRRAADRSAARRRAAARCARSRGRRPAPRSSPRWR